MTATEQRMLSISVGDSRNSRTWNARSMTFRELSSRLGVPERTSETVMQYREFSKEDREKAKDRGGFMGGRLKGTRRRKEDVASRSMLTLDLDKATPQFIDSFSDTFPFAAILYSTHSHRPESPRCRVIVPLARDVSPDEHNAIARLLASEVGMGLFDRCSFEINQMMFWPSCPSDGQYLFLEREASWLDPDVFLSAHVNWQDCSSLPMAEGERKTIEGRSRKQENPLEKEGIVGAWCRTYGIREAISCFLSDRYEATDDDSRYHYITSGSIAGLIVYDDMFAYSHHASDPAYGRLLNSFDLVRIHLFGPDGTFGQMADFASHDELVCATLLRERTESAALEFAAEPLDDDHDETWKTHLKRNRKGELENTLLNIRLILQNDPNLKGIVFNRLADGMEKRDVPWKSETRFWRDADDAQLICYVDDNYGSFSARNFDIAVTKVTDDRSYHPIRDMFASLPEWDGVPRVDTLLVDFLGAEDSEYVRAVTRKTLCAAYRRVMEPGIKFDTMIVLVGPQGIGKSTLISRLGGQWYSDSLNLSDMNDKTGAEKLQGYWVIEIGELAGMKKADLDKTKAFISRQDDKYRAAFGRRVTPHPRQCVFFGTTNNENGYLRDITGNRRFWNVSVTGEGRSKPWDITEDYISQVWSEAMVLALSGEPLHLDDDLEEVARKEQRSAMEKDDREGLVREYLETLLPKDWAGMDLHDRRIYLEDPESPTNPKGSERRCEVSNMEIWCECFGRKKDEMKSSDSYAISTIMASIEGWDKPTSSRRLPLYGKQRVYVRRNGK